MKAPLIVKDSVGAIWEKRGNTAWVECPKCQSWFPASPIMLRNDAPPAICPNCHHEFYLAAIVPRVGE